MNVLPRRRRAALINSVLAVAVLAGAGGAYAAVTGGSDGPARGGARTVAVSKGTVLATVSGSGSLSSPSDAGVNFTTGGRLTEVDVKPGDKVTKGQLLGKVDATAATETLTQARAALTAAQANVTKAEAGQVNSSSASSGGSSSSKGGSAPAPAPTVDAAQVAQARSQLTQAQNAVESAQRAVDGTALKAPAAGTVASVSAKVGDTVSGTNGNGGTSGGNGGGSSAGSASSGAASSSSALSGFVVLTNPSGMQVTANFSETDALKLKPGQPATVTLNAMSGKVLNAQVLSVSSLPTGSGSSSGGGNSGGGSAVQYAATLTITSPTDDLRSGLSASIQVVVGEASGALSVPTAAVSGTGANRTVTVVKADGTAVRTPVTVGLEGDSADQILSGLAEGEQVQLTAVSSTGSGGFPGGAFPGGAGAGATRNRGAGGAAGGGGGFRTGGGGGGRG
ncbi:HlyD family efflux transporter periplasmic adaptor subunit [Streptomyces flavotricini]|uniref:HlyD family efflux transporter periplasmic adaptor subunit n=1 Tax=Streptomyces flavotricini TaxID=66888 RepID=A0ABS8EFW2_9ACTN|nr:biotin/lipoyl-binding protein [Streptomyces flavotricini]MCC0100046.1 HlyD family efflux transporter periplasmic adaptor subunit [Streptomyces flavotricini]